MECPATVSESRVRYIYNDFDCGVDLTSAVTLTSSFDVDFRALVCWLDGDVYRN